MKNGVGNGCLNGCVLGGKLIRTRWGAALPTEGDALRKSLTPRRPITTLNHFWRENQRLESYLLVTRIRDLE